MLWSTLLGPLARSTHTQPSAWFAELNQRAAQASDILHDTVQIRRKIGLNTFPADDLSIFIYQTGGSIGAAQVDADSIHKRSSYK